MARVAQRGVWIMRHLVTDPAHGYSQPNRAGIGTGGSVGETITLDDGTRVGIAAGDRDCSSAAIECFAAQGVDCGGAWSTSDMEQKMVASGNFASLPRDTWRSPEPGDLLLAPGKHVAMYMGDGKVGEFVRSERHSTHGALGDQDGGESIIRSLYDDGWTCVLRYVGPEREQTGDEPATEPEEEEEEDMPTECLISIPQSGDMPCSVTVYVCGDRVHDLANPEVVKYLNEVYKACHGRDIPCFEMSAAPDFPAFQRVLQGLRGGIPDPSIIPNVDCYVPRSGNRADGCTGTEGM